MTYRNTLAAAMNNVKGEDGNWSHVVKSYEISKEDIDRVKQYVVITDILRSPEMRIFIIYPFFINN